MPFTMHTNETLATKIGSNLIKVDFFDYRILERGLDRDPLKPKSPDIPPQTKSYSESPCIRIANIKDSNQFCNSPDGLKIDHRVS